MEQESYEQAKSVLPHVVQTRAKKRGRNTRTSTGMGHKKWTQHMYIYMYMYYARVTRCKHGLPDLMRRTTINTNIRVDINEYITMEVFTLTDMYRGKHYVHV